MFTNANSGTRNRSFCLSDKECGVIITATGAKSNACLYGLFFQSIHTFSVVNLPLLSNRYFPMRETKVELHWKQWRGLNHRSISTRLHFIYLKMWIRQSIHALHQEPRASCTVLTEIFVRHCQITITKKIKWYKNTFITQVIVIFSQVLFIHMSGRYLLFTWRRSNSFFVVVL